MASLQVQRQRYIDEEMNFIRRRHPLFALKVEPFQELPLKMNINLEKYKPPYATPQARIVSQNVKLPIKLPYRRPANTHHSPKTKRTRSNYALPPLNPQLMEAFTEGHSVHFEFNTRNRFYVEHQEGKRKRSRSKYEQAFDRFARANRRTNHQLKSLQDMVQFAKRRGTTISDQRQDSNGKHFATEPCQPEFRFHEDDIDKICGLKSPTLRDMLWQNVKKLRRFLDTGKNDDS